MSEAIRAHRPAKRQYAPAARPHFLRGCVTAAQVLRMNGYRLVHLVGKLSAPISRG